MTPRPWSTPSRAAAPAPRRSSDGSDPLLPAVNQPVLLRGEDGEFASRIEDVVDGALTLARPFGLPLDTTLDDGVPFEVRWTSGSGVFGLPVRVTERAVDGRIRVWHAEPLGPAKSSNRRAHVRVAVAVPMTLEIAGETINASVLDVSEAALRCQVKQALPETGAKEGEEPPVRVLFELGGADFALDGSLFRSTPGLAGFELVIRLPEDERTASAVRKAVFAEQIRARQLAR